MSDKKVDVNLISSVKQAEKSLAQEEARRLEDAVPDGHILKDEVDKQKALLGDLADLPPGHPLLKMLTEAKERFETADQREDEQSKTREVRQAKRIEADQQRREREAKRLEAQENRHKVAKSVNKTMDALMGEVRSSYVVLASAEEVLAEEPICKTKMLKLKRLLYAMERGISECKITRV